MYTTNSVYASRNGNYSPLMREKDGIVVMIIAANLKFNKSEFKSKQTNAITTKRVYIKQMLA